MDIRNWPLDRIMQLPDCCFGRRWPIATIGKLTDAFAVFDIAEAALPERCVIWEVWFDCVGITAATIDISVSLGDALPTSEAIFTALEPVFSGINVSSGMTFGVIRSSFIPYVLTNIKMPVASAGRRFAARFIRVGGDALYGQATLVVSSIPTEVPDWLISGQGRSL